MEWMVYDDGSFDLVSPGVCLRGAYPAMDDAALHPLEVAVTRRDQDVEVRYRMLGGTLTLRLAAARDGLVLESMLVWQSRAPLWFYPLSGARIENARQCFRQGVGFSGPTNFVDLAGLNEPVALESYLFTGLVDENGATLVAGAREHCVFQQKSHLYNKFCRQAFRNRETERNTLLFEAGFATERITPTGGQLILPPLYFSSGADPYDTLRAAAAELARHNSAQLRFAPTYHWCSWYDKGCNLSLDELERFLEGCRRQNEPLDCVQIDDGYCSSPGDWLTPHDALWPGGLAAAFERIRFHGYRPGIWIAPFMVGSRSHLFRRHPDWMLTDRDGCLLAPWKNYDTSGIPSHIDEESYILDTSHPDAMAYLRDVFRQLRAWGAEFFKTGFMDWGFKDSTWVKRHTPGRTSAQYFDDVLRMIREEIGDSYWLACISCFAPFVGYADGMRVSSDVGVRWPAPGCGPDGSGGGVLNMIEETFGCQYFNNILWQNDPDVTFLRDTHTYLSDEEVRTLALWNGISGGSVNTSDVLPGLRPDRLRLWRFIRPGEKNETARPPCWHGDDPLKVLVRTYGALAAWAVLVMNPTCEKTTAHYTLKALLGRDAACVYSWGPDGCAPLGWKDAITVSLPVHGSALYYLAPDDAPPPPGLTLGGRLVDLDENAEA